MPKKQSKKKSAKESSDSLQSDFSSSESEAEEENDFDQTEVNDSDVDSDLEDEDDQEFEEEENIEENDSIQSIKEGDKDEDCFFAYGKENDTDLFDDDDYNTETQSNEFLSNDNRISINRMSLYEFVRLVGTRTKQLSMGAKPMIKNHQGLSSKEIAILELKNNTMPLIIKRPLPDNRYEIWKINELEKDHLF